MVNNPIRYFFAHLQGMVLFCTFIFNGLTISAQLAPDFKIVDTDGNSWHLYDELNSGKTVLLDFFYADCIPCQSLTPKIADIYSDYGLDSGNVLVLGISDRDNDTKVIQFENTYGVNYPSCGFEGNGDSVTSAYQSWFSFKGWPTYAVICPNGSIKWDLDKSQNKLPAVRLALDTCIAFTGISHRPPENDRVQLRGEKLFLKEFHPGQFKMRIVDFSGRTILKSDFFVQSANEWVDLSYLNPGIYVYSIYGTEEVYTGRIIKAD